MNQHQRGTSLSKTQTKNDVNAEVGFKKSENYTRIQQNSSMNSQNSSQESPVKNISPYTLLKLSTKTTTKSLSENIRIPVDPSAPYAFTLNTVSPHHKQKKNCLNQVSCFFTSPTESFKNQKQSHIA